MQYHAICLGARRELKTKRQPMCLLPSSWWASVNELSARTRIKVLARWAQVMHYSKPPLHYW